MKKSNLMKQYDKLTERRFYLVLEIAQNGKTWGQSEGIMAMEKLNKINAKREEIRDYLCALVDGLVS